MDPQKAEDDALASRVESGEYFSDARQWYDRVYIAPISQRIFFIIVASLAVLFMFMAFTSVVNLLPIAPRIPFAIYNDRMEEVLNQMKRFKKAGEPANPAIERFYVQTYVEKREAYSASRMLPNRAFVLRHSDTAAARNYSQEISQANAQSPVRRYGNFRKLLVQIGQIRPLAPRPGDVHKRVEVDFSTTVMAKELGQKTLWTATIAYEFKDLTQRNTYDEQLGDYVLDFDEPSFKVVSYEKRERLKRLPR